MMATLSYSQWREILSRERLPAVVVDLDAFDRNAAKIAQIARNGKKRLRIATKSIRVPALIRRALASSAPGDPYAGLMAYSAEEAAFLAEQGFDDLLVAYPTLRTSDLRALRETHDRGKRVMLVVDSPEGSRALAEAMRGAPRPFPVILELDASLRFFGGRAHLGVRRSPLRDPDAVLALITEIARHPELAFAGIMAYEAQIAGLGDRNPFKPWLNWIAGIVRRTSVRSVARQRQALSRALTERKIPIQIFNGGGTGSLNLAAEEEALTEVTAGSGLLCSHLFDYYSNIQLEPACFFALQAVRKSDSGFVTCQGGGYIASGEPGWDRVPIPYLPECLKLVGTEGCGEVQTPLQGPGTAQITMGEPVLFRHAKAGELAERFNEYLLVSQGRIVERVDTYRGLGKCFF